MAILVAYCSKHEATQGVAERIAQQLRRYGHSVELRPINASIQPESYEAVILGSAIYFGSWMKDATEFVRHHQAALARCPVWLFSVGPLSIEMAGGEQQPKELAEFQRTIHPRDHRIFYGALDHTRLSFSERMIVKAVKAPEGDLRNWGEIEDWANGIAPDFASTGVMQAL